MRIKLQYFHILAGDRPFGIETGYSWTAEARFPAGESYFSLLHSIQTGLELT
jgi:hypothetical protein